MVPISPTTCKVRTATLTIIQEVGVLVVLPADDGEQDRIVLVPPAAFMCVPPPPTPPPVVQRFAITAAMLNARVSPTKKTEVVSNVTIEELPTVEMQITDAAPSMTQLTATEAAPLEMKEDETTRKEVTEDSDYVSQVALFGNGDARGQTNKDLQTQQILISGHTEIDSPSSMYENQIDGIEEATFKKVAKK